MRFPRSWCRAEPGARWRPVYKGRYPEDASLDGLKKILAGEGVPAGN